ncbi:ARID domain-containing protein [Favolaschia claudopus]|uniref:ARID domain-containing protein n=1 Tax=Favolaschia claudopus TaxID=2862362 RepID=A0AAW0C1T4_9AGAR
MADRYNLLPNSFPPGMHQPQMGQNHLQQENHNQLPAFPDQGPMWQQMQQMQNQFRQPSSQMDPHVNPQVAELMRNQLARQGQQQQQQQQAQQQFSLQQMNPANPQAFLDPSNQQPQPSQSHPGFQNMGMSNPSLNNRNAMLQAFQQPNNPAAHRQLELMGLAHNQQPQNGPIHFANRMQHQALNGSSPPGGMGQPQQQPGPETFLSPSMQNAEAMRRPSPSHPSAPSQPGPSMNSMPPNLPNGMPAGMPNGPPPQVSRASFVALTERATNLKNIITNQESQLVSLTSQRTRIGDASFMDKVRTVSADLKNRKEHYARLVNFLHQIQAQLQANGQLNPMGNNNMPLPPQPTPGQPWMQAGPSSQPQQQFNQNGQPTNGQQGGPQGIHPGQNGHMPNHPAVPPRSGPTPQQFLGNPGAPNQPFQNQEGRHFPPIPPLEKGRFDNVYKSWCAQRNIIHNPRMMSIETRPLDLYDLHVQVMAEGGAAIVASKDLWAVIGGRMGFVQFTATDTEPAKSGPGVAQHLAHAYKEYLAAFDNVYVNTVLESRRKNDAITAAAAAAQRPMGMGGPSQPGIRPGGISDPSQMQMVMAYANIPLPELRRRGIPEQLIQFIENNRATLLSQQREALAFRSQVMRSDPARNPMQPGQPPFGGPQPVPGLNSGMIPPGQPFGGGMNHPGVPHNAMEGQGLHPMLARPSRENVQAAMAYISKLKTDYSAERMLANVPAIDVPVEQRMEYNTVLEQLHRACVDLDHKLPMVYAVLKKEDVVRRLVIIVQTAIQQRAMISSGSTRFLVTLDTLRTMLQQVQHMIESFATILTGLMGKGGPMGMPRPPTNHPVPPQQPNQPNLPPSVPPQPNNNALPPQAPPNRAVPLQAPPRKRPPTAGPSAPSPTPPPAASSSPAPVHNAPTPRDMSSPQAPKSPKTKPKAKPAPKRKASTASKAAPPVPPPEPATAPTTAPSPAGSNKRPREEEPSPPQMHHPSPGQSVANEPSPPKRPKTEWEGPPSEAMKEREQQVANVKTEDDGAAFLEQMTELFKMAAGNDEQNTLHSNLSETLDSIFKGFGASTDDSAGGSMASLGLGSDGGLSQDGGPPPQMDEFVEFFDFSSFGTLDEDDAGSKAVTPDLISSSSTNPSPESNNSEVDAAHQALPSDVKSEDFADHLRLGVFKEVDGGESAYYQSGQWKWDGPMQSLDQPWAIFNS